MNFYNKHDKVKIDCIIVSFLDVTQKHGKEGGKKQSESWKWNGSGVFDETVIFDKFFVRDC